MYGVYGGLHIAPFGPLKPEKERLVEGINTTLKSSLQSLHRSSCGPEDDRIGLSGCSGYGEFRLKK